MSEQSVRAFVAQRIIIRLLINESVKPVEILRRLDSRHDKETLSERDKG